MNLYGAYLLYVVASLAASVVLLAWAARRGQFRDQARASALALEGVSPVPADATTRRWPASMVLVAAIAAVLLVATAATLVVAVVR